FFKLEGKYLIDPDTPATKIKLDVAILLESSKAILQNLIDNAPDTNASGVLFALLYQLDMVDNLVEAIEVPA
ncbi:MAG TPA: hypothetical protein VMA74_15425, partial [Dyella sp.]|uniref:hypothetical protein n=1 Tax=Dyella sp. TaxID=1869338 RepID=UPI002C536BCB